MLVGGVQQETIQFNCCSFGRSGRPIAGGLGGGAARTVYESFLVNFGTQGTDDPTQFGKRGHELWNGGVGASFQAIDLFVNHFEGVDDLSLTVTTPSGTSTVPVSGGGLDLNTMAASKSGPVIVVVPATEWASFDNPDAKGVVRGLKAATGEILWSHDSTAPNPAPVAIVNDVAFQAGFDGVLHAFALATGDELWSYDLGASVSGGTAGSHVTPYASLWVPLSPRLFVGVGGGITWSSEAFVQQRFGVSPEASAASGLPVYSAGAGMRQYYLWPAVIYRVSKQWYAGAGAFYQRITGEAADSPIITQRGDPSQLSAGIGVGYSW